MCKGKAQNRIDYIVLQNPNEAVKILEKYGYEAPIKKTRHRRCDEATGEAQRRSGH